MKKAIICISLCLCLLLALTAGASISGISSSEGFGRVNADGTLTFKDAAEGVRFMNFREAISRDYFEIKTNLTFPEQQTDAWFAFVISSKAHPGYSIMTAGYGDCIVVQFRGFQEGRDASPSGVFTTFERQGNPFVSGEAALSYSGKNLNGGVIKDGEDFTFAIRANEQYLFTIEINGEILTDKNGNPLDFSSMREAFADKELYFGFVSYVGWYPAAPEGVTTPPSRMNFNLLAVNNNLPTASNIMTYNGEIPTETFLAPPEEPDDSSQNSTTAEPESSIVIDEGGSGCGNNA